MEPMLDALYGVYGFSKELEELIKRPPVQRLRDIRMSNIDSIEMPGISNISRYEHSLGAAHLASIVGTRRRMSNEDSLILQAAALLHDTAIPPFGHIVEEAWSYIGHITQHESRWESLLARKTQEKPGGINLQLFYGRESGLSDWASKVFESRAENALREIINAILGGGKFGQCICGDIDLDNLDNVLRAAFHMGLDIDKQISPMIAQGISDISENGDITFSDSAIPFIAEWLSLRFEVYEHFMTSESDFSGKVMLIHAVILAHEHDIFTQKDWNRTDREFICLLLDSKNRFIRDTVERWLLSERWPIF